MLKGIQGHPMGWSQARTEPRLQPPEFGGAGSSGDPGGAAYAPPALPPFLLPFGLDTGWSRIAFITVPIGFDSEVGTKLFRMPSTGPEGTTAHASLFCKAPSRTHRIRITPGGSAHRTESGAPPARSSPADAEAHGWGAGLVFLTCPRETHG